MSGDAERSRGKGLWWCALVAVLMWTGAAHSVPRLFAGLSTSYYADPEYAGVWNRTMMPETGPRPAFFQPLAFVFGLISSTLYVGVYVLVRRGIPGKSAAVRGLAYGAMLFCVAAVPGAFAQVLLLNLPLAIIVQWAAEGLIVMLAAGTLTGLLVK